MIRKFATICHTPQTFTSRSAWMSPVMRLMMRPSFVLS
jgi:hypothetical protein